MLKPKWDVPLNAVVQDSPAGLVLENRGRRYLAGIAVVVLAGVFLVGPYRLDQPVMLGATDVTLFARLFVGAVLLLGLLTAVDRQRIVFDAASGSVEFTSRVFPWKRLRRPAAEIERVETSQSEETYYSSQPGGGSASVTHHLHLVFRDKRRREVNRSNDSAFIEALAARIEGFRRGHAG